MDPVAAVGVAAAAVQFLDASIKAYNIFHEVRRSPSSTTERNQQLEHNIQAAQDLRASLVSSPGPQGATDSVSKLVAACASRADELLRLLDYIRGANEGIGSIRSSLRAIRKEKRVEELHLSLKEDRDALSHMIQDKLLPSINLLTVQQTTEFAGLNSIAQRLVTELVEQRKAQEDNQAALIGRVDDVNGHIQRRFDEADRSKKHEDLLKSLWFPEIDQRQGEIRDPAPNTLNWLFESEVSVFSSSFTRPWPSFRQWLREESSMYWISGKAGSGKSTLMAHIIGDKRTLKELNAWRDGRELNILSFFFWRAGSKLQTSITGLLRSLLCQICCLGPTVMDAVLSCLESRVGIPAWTEPSLCNHIAKAIRSADEYRFCIFINGLDEFQDQRNNLDDLVDHLNRLQDLENVKVCVSSRPELELIHRSRGLKQLRLQDLNRGDIEEFVQQSLAKTELGDDDRAYLAEEVVRRADGVFLWAALVAKNLINGSRARDSRAIMEERLNSLPGDMVKLFEQMLSKVDPVYRKSLALYVQLMMLTRDLRRTQDIITIPLIVVLQSGQQIHSYEEFVEECVSTETRITSGSAGLLEVYNSSSDGFADIGVGAYQWLVGTMKVVIDRPHFILQPKMASHRRCAANEPYPTMLDYERKHMMWTHRSAFEFFSDPSKRTLLFDSGPNRETLLRQVYKSYMSYIANATSFTGERNQSLTAQRMNFLLDSIAACYDSYPEMASSLLDNVYASRIQSDLVELCTSRQDKRPKYAIDISSWEIAFWARCTSRDLYAYMMPRIDRITNDIASEVDVAYIWFLWCS